jgi:hypothetical protein
LCGEEDKEWIVRERLEIKFEFLQSIKGNKKQTGGFNLKPLKILGCAFDWRI